MKKLISSILVLSFLCLIPVKVNADTRASHIVQCITDASIATLGAINWEKQPTFYIRLTTSIFTLKALAHLAAAIKGE